MAILMAFTCLLPGCGDKYGGGSGLTGIDISPISPAITVGSTQQFKATAHFNNGPDLDVTTSATWSSDNTAVSTVSAGLAKGLTAGSANITVDFIQGTANVQASTDLTVNTALVSPTGAQMDSPRTTTILLHVAPGVPESFVSMDSRVLGPVMNGGSLSIDVPAGPHRFLSPDGKHAYALNLRAGRTYALEVPLQGRLDLKPLEGALE